MRFNNLTNKQFNFAIILFVLVLAISSCERDDICIDDTTPNFTIRFYDSEEPTEFKAINGLEVTLLDVDVETLSFSSDSIQLPIRNDVNVTAYSVTNELSESDIKTDTITLTYIEEEVFVGRACGFKSVFNNVIYQNTSNWITNLEIVTETIEDETQAHVKIFH